ncbi:Uma2 family endonuclease [Paractinoplanes abujensis]|uniref:Uma2 family endonuclease n=1 Tax=Paractinoplanes abujensis TaxID=882441 RepID=A0A7W7CVT1_9ACTN|nr:Uma2 family endonuclease [Actinoplanes abujensis]MBB4695551.1 Uma2 family endonuclease [Actinoplanes abujensis]
MSRRVGTWVPDLMVWAKEMPPSSARSSCAGTAGLLLAVEVVSGGSEVVDRIIKKAEYANAGIPRYWFIERDGATTVHRHTLNDAGEYELELNGPQPFAWLITTVPGIR